MLQLLRFVTTIADGALYAPLRGGRLLLNAIAFNPKLGPLRYVFTAAFAYLAFALMLVYVVAPLRGLTGGPAMRDKLGYDAERWLATAIYDPKGNFVGTFDARLDSLRDVNYTDSAIELGDYVANPDHKSIPVKDVPEQYWKCLVYHEDRYIGSWLNPYGIDLTGVLKIPLSTITRSIALKRPSLGVGGSTLPMQFARVIYKTPPSKSEGGLTKLGRKFREWWLAPVIYNELTRGGDDTLLKQWAANHIWLAQRTGGQPLTFPARLFGNRGARLLRRSRCAHMECRRAGEPKNAQRRRPDIPRRDDHGWKRPLGNRTGAQSRRRPQTRSPAPRRC